MDASNPVLSGTLSTGVQTHPVRFNDPFEQAVGFTRLLYEMQHILELKYYGLSLLSSLTIPDICGGIDSLKNKASGANYVAWYDTHLSAYQEKFDGKECYLLRCSLLHQGQSTHEQSQYDRVMFCLKGKGPVFHKSTINVGSDKAVMLCLDEFCADIHQAARSWYEGLDATGKHRVNDLFKPTNGYGRFVVGLPIMT